MNQCVFIILLFIINLHSLAVQSQTTLSGTIVGDDGKEVMAGVTLKLLNNKDSILTTTATNKSGFFVFNKLQPGGYIVEVIHLGYQSQLHSLQIAEKPIQVQYRLVLSEIELDEIVVTGRQAVVIKGDTLEYDATRFKTAEYADADELVAQIPGVELDEDGNVKAQGEAVTRVIVDGKEFFSSDPRIALRTLPADIIDKVQIIDEKSERARFSGFDDGQRNKVINIVTKPDRRHGYFGRILAGKGDGSKFSGNAQINGFNGDKRYSLSVMGNNINETGFQEMGRGRSRRGNTNTDRGLADTYALAGSFNNSYLDKKMSVSADYQIKKSNTSNNTWSNVEYLIGARANQFQEQDRQAESKRIENGANARITWEIDSANRLDIRPNFSYNTNDRRNFSWSATNKEQMELINQSERSGQSENSNLSFGGNLTYMHRFSKQGRTISLNLSGNKNSNDDEGLNLATTEYYLDAVLNRVDTNNNRNYTEGYSSGFNSNISYTEQIARYSRLQASYSFRNTHSYSNRETFEFLAETGQLGDLRERLSNEFRNDYNYHDVGLSYLYNKSDTLRIQFGLNYQHGIRNNHRVVPIDLKTEADFGSFLPSFTIAYYFTKSQNLEFNYNTATNTPSINQLQDFIDNQNELRITNGNPDLKQEYSHRFRLQYRDVNRETGRSFTSNVSFDFINDKIINSVLMTDTLLQLFDDVVLGAGGQYSIPINVDGAYDIRMQNSYGVPLNSIKSNLNLNTNLFLNRSFAEINHDRVESRRYGFNQTIGLRSNFSRKYIIGLNYRFNANFTDNPSSTIEHYKVFNHNLSSNLHLEFLKNFVVTSNMTYFYNGGVNNQPGISTTLLNATLGYKLFPRRNAEIAIKGFDLLNNAQNINRQVNEISVSNSISNTLNRYFLLTFTYNLRQFGGAQSRQRGEGGGFGGGRSRGARAF